MDETDQKSSRVERFIGGLSVLDFVLTSHNRNKVVLGVKAAEGHKLILQPKDLLERYLDSQLIILLVIKTNISCSTCYCLFPCCLYKMVECCWRQRNVCSRYRTADLKAVCNI